VLVARTFEIDVPDPNSETTNDTRAQRIDALLNVYAVMRGEVPGSPDAYELGSLLTDVRHWCDQHDVDIYVAMNIAYDNYLQERADPETDNPDCSPGAT